MLRTRTGEANEVGRSIFRQDDGRLARCGSTAPWGACHATASILVEAELRFNYDVVIFSYDFHMSIPTRPSSPASRPRPTAAAVAPVHRGDRLRLRHLRLLDLVRRRGSLGAAARALGVSQPAATLLLRELESAFGAALVERDRHGARVTASGLRALERLTVTLSSFEHAVEAARMPSLEPALRVGAVQMAGMRALPRALAALERAGHAGRIELREGRARDLLGALREGALDCVIGWMDESLADAAPVEQLRIEPLWYSRMLVVAAAKHPLAKARSVDVAELSRWRWVVPPPGSRTHAAFLQLFLHNGVAVPPVAVECAALHSMLHIVAATRFLAVAPDTVVGHYARQHLVTALRGRALDLGRNQVSLVTRRDSDALQAVTRFREALSAATE